MAWKSIISGTELDNVKEDKKKSLAIEQYRISDQAIYFKGQYLPIRCIKDIKLFESTYTPGMSCGKGIPVFKIRLDYGAEKPLVLMIEKEANAEKMISLINSSKQFGTLQS